jgi:hypothetical protein
MCLGVDRKLYHEWRINSSVKRLCWENPETLQVIYFVELDVRAHFDN